MKSLAAVTAIFTTLFSCALYANNEKLKAHVNFLTSNKLQGRLTGTKGERLAAAYIANKFQKLGLQPAGDNGTYFQRFTFVGGSTLGNANSLTIIHGATKHLKLNQDWRPLSFSDNQAFHCSQLIFHATDTSYKGIHVKNKCVVVINSKPLPYSTLRHEAFTAKERGAKAIFFINDQLPPFSFETTSSGSGIVAIAIKKHILDYHALRNISLIGKTDIKQISHHGQNVLAKLKFRSSSQKMIIIGAHLDHLGRGEYSGSRARDKESGMIHPGADDNASGIASMLEAASMLANKKNSGKLAGSKDIFFAAWSGEELGALGSSYFVNQNKQIKQVYAAINLDMVGHLRKKLAIQGVGSSEDWPSIIKHSNTHIGVQIISQNDPYLPTDSTPLYLHGIPTLNFFTGAHDDYHTPRDRAETLNYEGLQKITALLVDLITSLENKSGVISYHDGKRKNDTPLEGRRIYLGTIPDYTSADVIGVKLSGVAKGSPAARAGLRRGDVITALAGKKVHDIYDYTFVINQLEVNKSVGLVVRRGDAVKAMLITAKHT